jgi:hypothetical protein
MLVATLNFVVNPYAQYPTRLVRPLVQTSRSEKVSLLAKQSVPPQGLILGSSRVLKFEPSYLQEKTSLRFFNAGMNYARPEDILAFLRHYQMQHGRAPHRLLIGLDVAAFSDAAPVDARLLSEPTLGSLIPEAKGFSGSLRPWQELLSWQQTVSSLRSLQQLWKQPSSEVSPDELFQPDGLLTYVRREREMAKGTYDFAAALAYNQREYESLFRSFGTISPLRCELMEQILDYCDEHHTEVSLFLTPLHPQLKDHLCMTTGYAARQREVSRMLRRLAERHQCPFVDFSDLRSFQGDPRLFVDGIHPLEQNTRRMIDLLLAAPPERTDDVI